LKLEPDLWINGRWVTVADSETPRRVELLTDLIQEYLSVSNQLASAEMVTVYRISGEVESIPRAQVTATDWLRLLVREHALSAGAVTFARSALDNLQRKDNEAWNAVAARVLLAFRATLANADRPYITESALFWRFVTILELKTLYEKLLEVLLPLAVDRLGLQGTLHTKAHETDVALRAFRMEWHDPMSANMTARGVTAERMFRDLVSVLAARAAQYSTPRASSKKIGGPDRLFSMDATRLLFSSPDALRAATATSAGSGIPTPLPPANLPTPVALAALAPALPPPDRSPSVAAFHNQSASNPGTHGVQFVSTKSPSPAAPTSASPPTPPSSLATTSERPLPSAPRRQIIDHLRSERICFSFAFSGECRFRPRSGDPCPYTHDPVYSALYKDVARPPAGGPPPRRRIAALSPAAFTAAVELGLIGEEDGHDEADTASAAPS